MKSKCRTSCYPLTDSACLALIDPGCLSQNDHFSTHDIDILMILGRPVGSGDAIWNVNTCERFLYDARETVPSSPGFCPSTSPHMSASSSLHPQSPLWQTIPDDLRGTPIGSLLMDRMLTNSWVHLKLSDVPHDWLKSASPDECTMFEYQKFMGLKRTDTPSKRVCAYCGATEPESGTEDVPTKLEQCSGCLSTYYCGSVCQTRHWRTHKRASTPPQPRIDTSIALTMPDLEPCWRYLAWWKESHDPDKLLCGLMIEPIDMWTSNYGAGAIQRCLLSLAVHGRPLPMFAQAWYNKSASSSSAIPTPSSSSASPSTTISLASSV